MGSSMTEIFVQGGWVMWPLLIFSVITWAIVFERAFVYFTVKPKLTKLTESLLSSLKSGDKDAAKQICHTQKPEIAALFLATMEEKGEREDAERVTERNRIRFMHYLKKNVWILGTIGSAAPFIGLLGTVLGIVRAFNDMHDQGTGGFSVVAGGISEALIATAAGLIVAIIALLTYNVFVTAANQTVSQMKVNLDELIDHARAKGTK